MDFSDFFSDDDDYLSIHASTFDGLTLEVLGKKLAYFFHRGQRDKTGKPYTDHLERVAESVRQNVDAPDVIKDAMYLVAYLHDIVEDTDCSIDTIDNIFGETIGDAVDAITRREDETYKEYVRRCCENPLATYVKWYDVQDNLSPQRYWDDAPLDRYLWTLGYIYKVIGEGAVDGER